MFLFFVTFDDYEFNPPVIVIVFKHNLLISKLCVYFLDSNKNFTHIRRFIETLFSKFHYSCKNLPVLSIFSKPNSESLFRMQQLYLC